eukprot:1411981-Amphidinium_carterae.1
MALMQEVYTCLGPVGEEEENIQIPATVIEELVMLTCEPLCALTWEAYQHERGPDGFMAAAGLEDSPVHDAQWTHLLELGDKHLKLNEIIPSTWILCWLSGAITRQKGAGGYWLSITRDADKYRDVHLGQGHVEQRRFANWGRPSPQLQ